VSHEIIVQFLGYEVKAMVREYTFAVRDTSSEPREFTLTIPTEAFNARLLSIQDAPDLCSRKLRRELATYANNPPDTHFAITNAELEDYRSSRAPRTPRSPFSRKPVEDY
jgi:hypothetical protein